MKTKLAFAPSWLSFAAASVILLPLVPACAQSAPTQAAPAKAPASAPAPSPAVKPGTPETAAQQPDRAVAYYHLALANVYEDEAVENGNNDAARLAVDEYKYALNADPTSPQLNDGLADLYFRPHLSAPVERRLKRRLLVFALRQRP